MEASAASHGADPLGGVTANVGGATLAPLEISGHIRLSHDVAPLQLEPSPMSTSVSSASRLRGSVDAQRLQWLWGEWGTPGRGHAAAGGGGGGGGGSERAGPAEERVPMDGLDPPWSSAWWAWVLWALELPLSVLRWATIPSSDGSWDRRRRLWTAVTPPLAACLFAAEVFSHVGGDGEDGDGGDGGGGGSGSGGRCPHNHSLVGESVHGPTVGPAALVVAANASQADAPSALRSIFGELMQATFFGSGVPLVVCILLLATPLCALVLLGSRDSGPPRWQPLLVVVGFAMTIVWLDRIATELIALIETFGHLFHVSTAILGLTVIAIGNSIGDFVADTAAAREGTVSGARMAVAACFGSPVIMNVVSVGLSFSLRLLLTGGGETLHNTLPYQQRQIRACALPRWPHPPHSPRRASAAGRSHCSLGVAAERP